MPTEYSTLSYQQKKIYQDIQGKIESFQPKFSYQGVSFEWISKVFQAVLEDHPEYFWLSGGASGTTKQSGGVISVDYEPKTRDSASYYQSRQERQRFESKVSKLISLAKRRSPDVYNQMLFLHDYMVLHTDYCLGAPHCYDAYGCLVLGRAVCDGYAAAFQVLMNRLGVECGRMRGSSASARTGEVSHAWNYVKLPDGCYFVDVTWDDPVVSNGTHIDNLSHEYFCLDLNEMRLTHRFSDDQVIPRSFGKQYNYFRYFGSYVERYSFEAVQSIVRKQLLVGNKFSVKFGSQAQCKTAVRDLIDNQRVYSIPGISNGIRYSLSKSGLVLTVYLQ